MASVPKNSSLDVLVKQSTLVLETTLARARQIQTDPSSASRDEHRRALIELIECLEQSLKEAVDLHDAMTR